MSDPAPTVPTRSLVEPATGLPVQVIYAWPPGVIAGEQTNTPEDSGLNLADLVGRLRSGWRLIATTTVIGALIAVGYSLSLPDQFTAQVTTLPPGGKNGGGGLAQYADLASMAGVSLPGGGGSADEVMAILGSRTLAEGLVDEFKLKDYYQEDERNARTDDLYKSFTRDFTSRFDKKSSLITFSYTHESPETAAKVANRAAELLQDIFNRIHQSSSKRERAFLDSRLAIAERDLSAASEKLAAFQREHRAFQLEAQTKATVEAVGQLQGQLIGQQVELRALLSSQVGNDNPKTLLLRERIEELAKAIERLIGKETPGDPQSGILLGLGDLPELGIQYVGLYREVKKNESLLSSLTAQAEGARIAEVRNSEVVTIIDQARVPDRKSGPRRAQICAVGTLLALLAGIGLSLWYSRPRPVIRPNGAPPVDVEQQRI
jgi:tyrosine-protein kinase Etk/Wzc